MSETTAVRYRPLIATMPAQLNAELSQRSAHLTPAEPASAPAAPIVVYRRRDNSGVVATVMTMLLVMIAAVLTLLFTAVTVALLLADMPWISATFGLIALGALCVLWATVRRP